MSSSGEPQGIAASAVQPVIGRAMLSAGRVVIPVSLNGERVVSAKAYSLLGKEVLDFGNSLTSGTLGFDAKALPAGSYMLSVQVGSIAMVQKIGVK